MGMKPIIIRGIHPDIDSQGKEVTPAWASHYGVSFLAANVEGPNRADLRDAYVHLTPFDIYQLLGAFTAAHFHGSKEDWQAWVRVMNMLKAMDPEMAALKAAGLGVQ